MFLIVLTFVLTTAIYGILLWLAVSRVLRQLQGNEEGVRAVTRYVLLPLLGRRPDEQTNQPDSETETP